MTGDGYPPDKLAALYANQADHMVVAWNQLLIPGPPEAFALNPVERTAPSSVERFRRRTIQTIPLPPSPDASAECLSFVDKAMPHA